MRNTFARKATCPAICLQDVSELVRLKHRHPGQHILDDLRRHDPEAAEVIRRRRGLDGLGEEEALESIAATGLTCTGRTIGRESVRQIQKRGEAVLRRRAADPTRAAGS